MTEQESLAKLLSFVLGIFICLCIIAIIKKLRN
jgi:hypothetical protein